MKKLNLSRAVIQACLIFWAALQIFPLYWLLTFSLKDNTEIFQGNMVGLPSVWRFENYTHAFMGGNVGRYLANSIIVTAATILIVCIASLMASYALIRMKWKLQKTFQLIFIMGITIPRSAAARIYHDAAGAFNQYLLVPDYSVLSLRSADGDYDQLRFYLFHSGGAGGSRVYRWMQYI